MIFIVIFLLSTALMKISNLNHPTRGILAETVLSSESLTSTRP
jgi:hypothetical protein